METNEVWSEGLVVKTPEEGIELASKIARKRIEVIQTDADFYKRLRPAYANGTAQLITSFQVVATQFQTIAAANNY